LAGSDSAAVANEQIRDLPSLMSLMSRSLQEEHSDRSTGSRRSVSLGGRQIAVK
jgi:hypothetical protein